MQENPTFCFLIIIELIILTYFQRYPIAKYAARQF
jgi:hypothetical protein